MQTAVWTAVNDAVKALPCGGVGVGVRAWGAGFVVQGPNLMLDGDVDLVQLGFGSMHERWSRMSLSRCSDDDEGRVWLWRWIGCTVSNVWKKPDESAWVQEVGLMKNTVRTLAIVVALASLVAVGCKKRPPKEPETDYDPYGGITEEPKEAPKPEPPPPPKCEALDENCKATSETWVEIGEEAKFQPAEGWTYAKLENMGIAKADEDAAFIAYRVLPAPLNPKKDFKGTVEALVPVYEALGVTVPEAVMKKAFRKAGAVDDKGELELSTWQLDGAKLGEAEAVVIVITAKLGEEHGIVGAVALKTDSIQDHLEAVQKSYLSVRGAK